VQHRRAAIGAGRSAAAEKIPAERQHRRVHAHPAKRRGEDALNRMVQHAQEIGADAITGCGMMRRNFPNDDWLEVPAYGNGG